MPGAYEHCEAARWSVQLSIVLGFTFRVPNETSIYGKRHIPGGLAGVYISGVGVAGLNSVGALSTHCG